MKGQKIAPTPEFSRPIALESLHDGENTVAFEATQAERTALAKRFDLLELPAFAVRYSIWPDDKRTGARATGRLTAEVVQACVVTLEPVRSTIAAEFDRVFAPADETQVADDEAFVDPTEEEPPDPVVAGTIDLGESAAEQLALEIDPFPRAPGAEFRGFSSEIADSSGDRESPFAALAKLKGKL